MRRAAGNGERHRPQRGRRRGRARRPAAARLPAHLAAVDRRHARTWPGHHRVIAPDLRGLGASTRAAGGYDAGTLAADAEALLDALGRTVGDGRRHRRGHPARLPARPAPSRTAYGAWSSWSHCSGGCPVPRTSSPAGRRGGSASTPSPASPRPSWPVTRRSTSAGSSTPARCGRGVPPAHPRRLRPRVHRARRPAQRLRPLPGPARKRGSRSQAATAAGRLDRAHRGDRRPPGRRRPRTPAPPGRPTTSRTHLIEDCGHIIPLDRPDALVPLLTSVASSGASPS